MKQPKRFCDGAPRRDFLRVGTAAMLGANLTLPRLLQGAPAPEKSSLTPGPKSDLSVIFVFLHGGLSTIDTFDLKPDAPVEIRGEFQSIPTNIPGIRIGEHLKRTAQQMDKISLVRSFTHNDSGHGSADHYMLTGYHTVAGFNAACHCYGPNNGQYADARCVPVRRPCRAGGTELGDTPGRP